MQSLCSEEDEEESFEQLFSKFRLMKGPNHSYENNFILILIYFLYCTVIIVLMKIFHIFFTEKAESLPQDQKKKYAEKV